MNGLGQMYPDIYKHLKPYIDSAADMYGGEALDETGLANMAAEAVSSSGIMRAMPRGHSSSSVADFAKAMLLTSLFNRYGYPVEPYPYPYPVYPIFPVGRPGYRAPFRAGFRHGRR